MDTSNTNRENFWRKSIRELRPMIAKLVNNYNKNSNSLNEDDIDDILQESVLVLYEKTIDPTFNLTSKPSTYIYAVAENKIRERIRKKINNTNIEIDETYESVRYDEYDIEKDKNDDWRIKILKDCVELLNKTQKYIFTEFYYHKKSMEELANELDSTIRTMISQKYKATISVKDCSKSKL